MTPGLKRLPARFYRSDSGREPVRECLKRLDAEDRKILGEDIKDVEFSWPHRHATGSGSRARIVGSGQQFAAGADCPRSVLRGERMHGASSRLHQEDPKNTAAGFRLGAQAEERRRRMKKNNIGSSFDSWLREEGIYQEVTATAIKRVLARQVEAAMEERTFPRRKWLGGCIPAAHLSSACWTQKTLPSPSALCKRPRLSSAAKSGWNWFEGQPPCHTSSRETAPCSLLAGLTVISTSWPRAVRKSMSRSTEKLPDCPRIRPETCGCRMPRIAPGFACVSSRSLISR